MSIDVIVTTPPHAPFIEEVLSHPIVSGIRLNTVMPLKGSIDENVKRLSDLARQYEKAFWVDLKTRQLRVADYGVPPFTEITLSHDIQVETPVTAYFSDGKESATVLAVEKNKLIMQEGPKRVIGPGESVNILHPSLHIAGYFTDTDEEYIAACTKHDIHTYMLSFVEGQQDIDALYSLDRKATPMAKIESQKGLQYVQTNYKGDARLFTARGDLFVEVARPHHILKASKDILEKDAHAVAASRILSSLAYSSEPSCADLGDVDNLLRMGYTTLMLGDEVCLRRESVISALNVIQAISNDYR